jgi:hypothetical protein
MVTIVVLKKWVLVTSEIFIHSLVKSKKGKEHCLFNFEEIIKQLKWHL